MGSKYVGCNGYVWFLVVVYWDELVVFLVDEVEGVLCFLVIVLLLVLFICMYVIMVYVCGVLVWCDVIIGLFDIDCVFDLIVWSL